MNTGMMWFDNDPKLDIISKISRAMEYYQKKYGQKPNLVYINPEMKFDSPPKTSGLEIQTDHMVMPDHFWLGIRDFPILN